MNFVPPLGANNSLRFDQVVKRLRLASGCKLILDAADARSYGGSGQTWSDRSGGGYNVYLGATSGSEASDPAFTGAAGTLGAYFALDGGDFFTCTATNPSWVDACHQDNAKYTLAHWIYIGALGAQQNVFGSRGVVTAHTGVVWGINTAGKMNFGVANAGAVVLSGGTSTTTFYSASQWIFAAISIDEGAGTGFWYADGVSENLAAPTYSSPSAGAASFPFQIAANGDNTAPLSSGSRHGGFIAWQGVTLTVAQLDAFRQATRRRFGV